MSYFLVLKLLGDFERVLALVKAKGNPTLAALVKEKWESARLPRENPDPRQVSEFWRARVLRTATLSSLTESKEKEEAQGALRRPRNDEDDGNLNK